MKRIGLFLLLIALPLSGCDSAKAVEGCTDPNALNFNASAEDDNNSCIYQAEVSFYMTTDIHGLVEIAVDGVFLGVLDGVYSAQPGSCNQPFTVTLDGRASAAGNRFRWTATGQDGVVIGGEELFRRGCSFVRVF